MNSPSDKSESIYHGTFFGWFETGLEGMVWALQSDHDDSMEGLVILEKSDWVQIRSKNGEDVLYEGEIKPNYEIGKEPVDSAPKRNQPHALGCWIHWTQEGFEPDEWASFFIPGRDYTGYVRKANGE